MVNIVHIITGLGAGGAERALHSLLSGGLQDRFHNHVISLTGESHYGPLLRDAGISVSALGMVPGRPGPSALWNLRRLVRATSPDLIQGWMYHGNLAASLARYFGGRGTRLAWNIRMSREGGAATKGSTNALIRLGARVSTQPDAILYNSIRSRTQHEAEGYARDRGRVMVNGFDTGKWCPDSDAAPRLRQRIGVPPGKRLVGYVARAHPHKDPANLFAAFVRGAARDPASHLVCVGSGLAEAAPADLDRSRVSFLGEISDIHRIMPAFDVLCLSSAVEGFPNVIGEAMACAVPCVSTDVGDAARIVGDTGWIVPPGDSTALADALLRALACADDELISRGAAARDRIVSDYSLTAAVAAYDALYTQLLENR